MRQCSRERHLQHAYSKAGEDALREDVIVVCDGDARQHDAGYIQRGAERHYNPRSIHVEHASYETSLHSGRRCVRGIVYARPIGGNTYREEEHPELH